MQHTALAYDKPLTRPPSYFEYAHFTLPTLDAWLATRSISIDIKASFVYGGGTGPAVRSLSRPELLLLQVACSIDMLHMCTHTYMATGAGWGGSDCVQLLDAPHAGNTQHDLQRHAFCSASEPGAQHATPALGLHTALPQGLWHLALYNPGGLWEVGFTVAVVKTVHCPAACSGHGQCSTDGECECEVCVQCVQVARDLSTRCTCAATPASNTQQETSRPSTPPSNAQQETSRPSTPNALAQPVSSLTPNALAQPVSSFNTHTWVG